MHGALRPSLALTALVTLALAVVLLPTTTRAAAASSSRWYSTERKHQLRQLAEGTWRHAYDSYKQHAFPADELLPLSCSGQGHDRLDRTNAGVNDVMGDYLLTVVDSLDTFAMLGDKSAFEEAVREVIEHVSFDVDSRVQVFEVTIRMMGGLVRALSLSLSSRAWAEPLADAPPARPQLSGHLLALPPPESSAPRNASAFSSSIRGFDFPWYRSELLHLAHDLGRRLLPAFDTPTGIPFARVHLQTGVRSGTGKGGKALETGETCAAGAPALSPSGQPLAQPGTSTTDTSPPPHRRRLPPPRVHHPFAPHVRPSFRARRPPCLLCRVEPPKRRRARRQHDRREDGRVAAPGRRDGRGHRFVLRVRPSRPLIGFLRRSLARDEGRR